MNTKHPLFKAFKNGELIEKQRWAIGSGHGIMSAKIDPIYADDIRFFTGFEDSKGEPIYDGDTITLKGWSSYPYKISQSRSGLWQCESTVDGDCRTLYESFFGENGNTVTLFTERRQESRRDTNDRRKS